MGSVRVQCLGTQNRNPNLKPESAPNFNSGRNSSPKPKPTDNRNPTDNPKPEFILWISNSMGKTKLQQASSYRSEAARHAGAANESEAACIDQKLLVLWLVTVPVLLLVDGVEHPRGRGRPHAPLPCASGATSCVRPRRRALRAGHGRPPPPPPCAVPCEVGGRARMRATRAGGAPAPARAGQGRQAVRQRRARCGPRGCEIRRRRGSRRATGEGLRVRIGFPGLYS